MAKKIEIKTKAAATKTSSESKKDIPAGAFAFDKQNYMIILGGIAVLVIGYLLMIGGGADKPENYNPEIFSARRVTVAPITLLLGFGVVLYGIMKKPKTQE